MLGCLQHSHGVKQVCVLAPTLFGIFYAVKLKHAFDTSREGVYTFTPDLMGDFSTFLH